MRLCHSRTRSRIRLAFLHVVAQLLLVGLIACPTRAENPRSLTVGATLALTGKFAFIGEAERDGLILAVEEINQRPEMKGRELRLVIEDNAGEARAAVTVVQKLLESDKVDVVFSAFTHITRAIQPIVSAHNRLLIYASSVREMAEENEGVFRDYLDIQTDAELMARTLSGQRRKRIAYMRDNGDVCAVHEQTLSALQGDGGPKIAVREEFPAGEGDLRSLLLKLYREPEIDAVLFCGWRDMETIIRQGEGLGLLSKYPLYLTLAPFLPVADTAVFRKTYEKLGAVSTWYGFLGSALTPEQVQFIERFKRRFGYAPRPDAAYAYDDMMILVQAASRCSDESQAKASCLSGEILKTDYPGAAGRLQFSPKRVSSRPAFVMKVVNGEWQPLHGYESIK